jgi:hypothetical protein
MSFADKLKPHYEVGMNCDNCGKKCSIRIKKGVTVVDAVKNKEIKCENCKCIIVPKEYTTQYLK